MRFAVYFLITLIGLPLSSLWTQEAAAPSPQSQKADTSKAAKPNKAEKTGKPAKPNKPDSSAKPENDKTDKPGAAKPPGLEGAGTEGPTTTIIYADEAFFDSNKSTGIFTGRVKVTDPRFNLQSDKLTVFITKGENQGLERAVAEGNVGVVRDRPDPNGGPPTRAVGRSDTATYVAATGDVELKGTPRVQQGPNTHIATSPDTIMIINQQGQLTTHGPSRTDIRQEPKDEEDDGKKKGEGETKADASPNPKAGEKSEVKAKKEAKPKPSAAAKP